MSKTSHLTKFKQLLASFGMHPVQTDFNLIYPQSFLPVVLDGILLGYINPKEAE